MDKLLLGGEDLIKVLAAISGTVRWLRSGEKDRVIPTDMAVPIVKAGVYQGKVRGDRRRVYFIREADPRPAPVADDSFWFGMPALRNFRSLKVAASASYYSNTSLRESVCTFRQRAFREELAGIPSGRW